MYLKQVQIENYGAIEKLQIATRFSENGSPLPLIVVGQNGTGKTLFLANIADGLIEAKRQCYGKTQETEAAKYFKIGKKDYIFSEKDYSHVYIEYQNGDVVEKYTDFTTLLAHDEFIQKYHEITFDGLEKTGAKFREYGFWKGFISQNTEGLKTDLDHSIYGYFPPSRYDIPAWLADEARLGFDFNKKFVGESSTNIIKSHIIPEVQRWILDIVLDKELYEKQQVPLESIVQSLHAAPVTALQNLPSSITLGYAGKNTDLQNLINKILTAIYKAKSSEIEIARIGIDRRYHRRIAIATKNIGEADEKVIAPSFSHLSSGEIMLLSIFSSILKDFDVLNPSNPVQNLSDISGIVLIDEIDLHLHLCFQRNVLPELIALFPKVQFIISTHSPFFILGMKEKFGENYQLINLPDGNELSVDDFSEYREAFDAFIDLNEDYRSQFEKIREKIARIEKPLVITEGKTDWKHLKNALIKLQQNGKFVNLDFEFYEYEDEIKMGDSHLEAICNNSSKIPNDKKTICIFDRDNSDIIKRMMDNVIGHKSHPNNFYSFCIPVPSHRLEHQKISIEHYYTDEEIAAVDENGRKLFLSSEFDFPTGRHNTEGNISYGNPKNLKGSVNVNMSKILDSEVYGEYKNNIALPKEQFAQYILDQRENFNHFGVEEFEAIFSTIESILNPAPIANAPGGDIMAQS